MKNFENEYDEIERKEKKLMTFKIFTRDDALNLGIDIYKKSKEIINKPLGIEIFLNGMRVFCFYPEGVTRDHLRWIELKRNVVDMWEMSSYRMKLKLLMEGRTLESLKCNPNLYCAGAGAVPIFIEGVGMIGCISVSGGSGTQDHDIIMSAVEEYRTIQKIN